MGITKNLRVYLYIVVAAMALTACAKRDSDFAARKNASGATVVNGAQSQAADDAAAAAGYVTDVLAVMQPQTVTGGAISVTSYIKVNSSNYQVVTTHSSIGTVSKTQATFEGATFEVNGVCSSASCSPYYLIINISRNGQQIKQTAMKKFFYYSGSDSSQDLILSRGAGQFLSVQDAMTTLNTAVPETAEAI